MGIVRDCRRTTNANEVTRDSRLVLMSSISANGFALMAVLGSEKVKWVEGKEGANYVRRHEQ
jgi:hypothetical protein